MILFMLCSSQQISQIAVEDFVRCKKEIYHCSCAAYDRKNGEKCSVKQAVTYKYLIEKKACRVIMNENIRLSQMF